MSDKWKQGIRPSARVCAEDFNALPQTAKDIYFDMMTSPSKEMITFACIYNFGGACESPIEKIMDIALAVRAIRRPEIDEEIILMNIAPQADLEIDGKVYRADFCFELDDDYIAAIEADESKVSKNKIIVECDGHNYHQKTKAQVKHDNERDFILKLNGYDVLHFSGSQIYNEPYECADKVIDYIYSKCNIRELLNE